MHARLWDFSLAFYDDPQVQEACLQLQDECGADVNLLLLLLFRASQGCCITRERIASIDGEISVWRSRTTIPLRKMRRALKDTETCVGPLMQEEFRVRVKALELQSERLEQEYLDTIDLPGSVACLPMQAATINLSAYAQFLRADQHHQAFHLLRQRFDSIVRYRDN